MSKRKEKISAFLDGDMHRDELMSFSLSAEADDARVAQRYQLMGDALRDEVSESSFVDVSAAVRESLANENIADEMPQQAASTAPASKQGSGLFDFSGWFRPAAGMAMAAVVAVVMVISVSDETGTSVAPMAANEPVNVEAQPVVQLASENKDKETDSTVNQHRVNQHLEFATQDALQGRLPFVRAVSFEAEK